jgi:hypothetical protein
MNRTTPLLFVFLLACLLAACGEAEVGIPVTGQRSDLQLEVQAPDGEAAFRQGNGTITYNYVVTNTGPQSLRGPVIVEDAPRQVSCPPLNTVGDLDNELGFNESVTCTALYTPDEAERRAGSISNRARAIVGGMASNESTFTLGQAVTTPTVEAEPGTPAASQTSQVMPTVTQGTSTTTAETPSPVATATPFTAADATGTPTVIPTATVVSSTEAATGPTASPDSVNVIDLPAATETIVLPGIVPAGGSIRYSINAAAGQQLSLTFLVTTNQLAVSVTGPDGALLKTPEAALPWSETIPTPGDYLIEIVNTDSTAVQPYLLELRRTPPN